MKVLITVMLMLAVALGASAEPASEKLNLLWGIPFGISANEMLERVEGTGIEFTEKFTESGAIINITSKKGQRVRVSGMLIDTISLRDSRKFSLSNDDEILNADFVYNDAQLVLESVEKTTTVNTNEDLVFWLDYAVLPAFMREFLVARDSISEIYGEPDFMYYRPGYLEAAIKLDDIGDMSRAQFWLGVVMDSGGFPTYQHVSAVWNNVALSGHFRLDFEGQKVKATWYNTIRYQDHRLGMPTSEKVADVEINLTGELLEKKPGILSNLN